MELKEIATVFALSALFLTVISFFIWVLKECFVNWLKTTIRKEIENNFYVEQCRKTSVEFNKYLEFEGVRKKLNPFYFEYIN